MSDYDIEQTETSETTSTGATQESGDYVTVKKSDLEDIHLQLEELRSMNMAARQGAPAKPAPMHTQGYDEELPQIPADVVSDPAKLAAFIAKTTEVATQKAQKAITKESQKVSWDQRAEKDFPLTDAAFNKAVKAQIREMTSTGEYSPDHPMLVYRAAQLASMKTGTMAKQTMAAKEESDADPRPSSIAPSQGGGSAPRSRSKIPDNHPTVRAYKLFNPKATKEDVEKLKVSLEKQGTRTERRERNY